MTYNHTFLFYGLVGPKDQQDIRGIKLSLRSSRKLSDQALQDFHRALQHWAKSDAGKVCMKDPWWEGVAPGDLLQLLAWETFRAALQKFDIQAQATEFSARAEPMETVFEL